MNKLDKDTFLKLWEEADELACPLLRYYPGLGWLYPKPEDPCHSGECRFFTCHNYKKQFDEQERLFVPEEAVEI